MISSRGMVTDSSTVLSSFQTGHGDGYVYLHINICQHHSYSVRYCLTYGVRINISFDKINIMPTV